MRCGGYSASYVWRVTMKRGARWMTIVVVGICSFALLARMANFAHFAAGRRATTEGMGKSMGTGGAMETAWADQVVVAAGGAPSAVGVGAGGNISSGVGVSAGLGGTEETARTLAAVGADHGGAGGGVGSGGSIADEAMRDALVAQERAGLEALKAGDVAGF